MAIKNKTDIKAEINATIVGGGGVTATDLNGILIDIVDSYEDLIQDHTTVQRDLLTPFEGLKIYNTTSNRLEYYSATQWTPCSQKEVVAVNCSGNPNYVEALVGDQYIVSVEGRVGGASGKKVYLGDMVYCIDDNAGGNEATVGTKWQVCHSMSNSDSPTYYVERVITTAEILALGATPITIIAACAAGKINLIQQVVCGMVYNTVPYATSTNLYIEWDDLNNSFVCFDLSQANNWHVIKPFTIQHDAYTLSAIKVGAATVNPTAGNSDVKVGIYYKIHTM